jgi:hypothetical protein
MLLVEVQIMHAPVEVAGNLQVTLDERPMDDEQGRHVG